MSAPMPPTGPGTPSAGDPVLPGFMPHPGPEGIGGPAAPRPPAARPTNAWGTLVGAAAIRAGAGYVVALVVGLLQVLLGLLLVDGVPLTALVAGPPILAGTGMFGGVHVSASTSVLGLTASGGGTIRTLSLVMLAVIVGTVVAAGLVQRRFHRVPTTPAERWITAGFTGAFLAVIATLVALGARVSVEGMTLSGLGIDLFLGALVVGTLASVSADVVGRGGVRLDRIGIRVGQGFGVRAALTALGVQLAIPLAVLLIVSVVAIAFRDIRGLVALPLLGANAGVLAVGTLFGGGVLITGNGGALGMTSSTGTVGTLFNADLPWWAVTLLVLLAVVSALTAAAVLAIRRPVSSWARVWVTPTVYAAVALGLTVLTLVYGGGTLGVLGMGGSVDVLVMIGPWWFLAMAAWAMAVEVVARTAVAPVLRLLSPRTRAWLGRWVVPAAAATDDTSERPTAMESTTGGGAFGTPQAVGGPDATGPYGQPAAPMDPEQRRRIRRRVVWALSSVGAVIVLLVAGAITVGQINSRVYSPGAQASAFFDALERGSASEALELADLDLPVADQLLLTDEVYQAAESRPQDVRVRSTTSYGTYASVSVEYTQGDRSVTSTLQLEKTGRTGVFFDQWRIVAAPLGTVSTGIVDSSEVLVNGIETALESSTLTVLPGEYTVSLPNSTWLESSTATALVRGDDWVTLDEVTLTPTDAFQTEAERVVGEYLDGCIARSELDPDDCPNRAWEWRAINDVTWTLDQAPTYTIEPSWRSTTSFSVEARDGRATVSGSYAEESYSNAVGDPFTDQSDIRFSGTIEVRGDQLEFSYGY